jgi:beta-mannanase
MSLETGTYISDLNSSNPSSSDPKSQGDDHIRLLKSTIKTTFPNVSGAVTPTHTELNRVAGVTSAIQTQLDAKADVTGESYSGAHNFTSATVTVATQTAGDNSTKAATTAYVDQRAFSTALPTQTSNEGKVLTTDGTNASWTYNPTTPIVAYSLNAL